jgi:endonuclease/exonuclease/phosphatase family metal-dependent hydrolase
MTVGVASWNLQWAQGARARRLGELLIRGRDTPQIVLLQEANPDGLDEFCTAAGLSWFVSVHACFADLLSVRGRDGADRSRRPRGVAIAGTGTPLRSPVAFPDLPLPEKVLAGWVDLAGRRVTVVTYHAPTGVQHKQKKPEQAVRLGQWLTSIEGPALFAGDFNTPAIDHPDRELIRTHWHSGHRDLHGLPGDDLLVGPNEVHGLRDVFRTWLVDHPEELSRIRAEFPEGPLAVSHRTGTTRNARRYDAIWATDDFVVVDVRYHYEDAVQAGSDHALVLADLDVRHDR